MQRMGSAGRKCCWGGQLHGECMADNLQMQRRTYGGRAVSARQLGCRCIAAGLAAAVLPCLRLSQLCIKTGAL